jgi:ketosteroid isomerase-like protein
LQLGGGRQSYANDDCGVHGDDGDDGGGHSWGGAGKAKALRRRRADLALEMAWNHAEQNKDVAALDQLLAGTLVYIDYDGSLQNKAEFLATAKSESLHPEQITNDEVAAHVYGDAAVVTGIYREKGISKGKPYSRRGRFTDTWVKEKGTWLCVASQSTLMSK